MQLTSLVILLDPGYGNYFMERADISEIRRFVLHAVIKSIILFSESEFPFDYDRVVV